MICWSCGGGIPDGSNFCGLCGAQQNPTDRITRSGWLRALRDDARIGLPEPPPSAGKEPGRDTLLNPALTDPAPTAERLEESSVTTTRPRFAALAAASLPGGGQRLARPELEGAPSGEPSAPPMEPSAPPGAPSGPPVAASVEPSAPPVSGPTPSAAPSAAPPAASSPPAPAALSAAAPAASSPPAPAASAPPAPGPAQAAATPSRPAAHPAPAPPALTRLIPVAAAGLCMAIILWWML